MKRDLLEKLEQLAQDLPPNTLDELIDELGGPDNVAEVRIFMRLFFRATSYLVCTVFKTMHAILNVCVLCNADDWSQRQGSQQ